MKAAQIRQCSNNIRVTVNEIPVPEMGDDELLIRVKAAAVNPVDMLNLTGAIRLIQDDSMPLTPAMNAPVLWRKRADMSPDSGRETGSMPACRSSVSGKWPFPLRGVGHRLVADQRCLQRVAGA